MNCFSYQQANERSDGRGGEGVEEGPTELHSPPGNSAGWRKGGL